MIIISEGELPARVVLASCLIPLDEPLPEACELTGAQIAMLLQWVPLSAARSHGSTDADRAAKLYSILRSTLGA